MSRIAVFLALAGLSLSTMSPGARAANGAVGDRLPAEVFCEPDSLPEDWRETPKLVVLAPARSDYAGMLRLAFDRYFAAGLAFGHGPAARLQVVHVDAAEDSPLDLGAMMLPNASCRPARGPVALSAIAAATGTSMPRGDNADATVLLLDRDDVVRWRDDAYRAQGEHLKPLEAAIKSLLGRPDALAPASTEPPPALGETAPDFAIGLLPRWTLGPDDAPPLASRLSALRGKVVLVAFYPAAFSGTLPTVDGNTDDIATDAIHRERARMMSCALQIDELDTLAPDAALKGDVVKLAISASTPELLVDWRRTLRTRDIQYVNDADYAIARRYGSYDAQAGYNLRKVFVVGRDGRIVFVDEDYAPGDAQAVADALAMAAKSR